MTSRDPARAIMQIKQMLDELFQERVAGTLLGDVFTSGEDDILTLSLSSTGGLQKTESELEVKAKTTGGLTTTADGVGVKLDTTSLLELGTGGVKVTNTMVWAVGSVYQNVTGVNPGTELGYGTWTFIKSESMGIGTLTPLLEEATSISLKEEAASSPILAEAPSGSSVTVYYWQRTV